MSHFYAVEALKNEVSHKTHLLVAEAAKQKSINNACEFYERQLKELRGTIRFLEYLDHNPEVL